MAGITPESIDRLHANLLTSGVQQQNQALFYVVDQLINAVRQALSNVQAVTGGGGGGGGGIAGQSFITADNDTATLPNSLQLLTSNLNFNRQGNRLTINAPIPFPRDGMDGMDGFSIPGPVGPQGLTGPAGPPGMDCCIDCCGEVVPLLPIGILTSGMDALITGAWIFERSPNSNLDVRGPQAGINVVSTDAIGVAQIFLQSDNGLGLLLQKFDTLAQLTLGSDTDALEIVSGGAGALVGVEGVRFPATQVPSAGANTLDDYQEGTWTPADGSGAGLVITVVIANFVKVGRLVHVDAQIVYPATASGAAAIISGLPFTAAGRGALSIGAQGAGPAGLQINIVNGTTVLNFNIEVTAAAATNAQMTGANLFFSGTYMADA